MWRLMGGSGCAERSPPERTGQSRQDICLSRADFLPFLYANAICLGQYPAPGDRALRSAAAIGFNKRYLAGNRAGALGATALVPGELRAALAPSRLLLLVHAFISWPTWSTSSAGGCAALGDCTEPRLLFDSQPEASYPLPLVYLRAIPLPPACCQGRLPPATTCCPVARCRAQLALTISHRAQVCFPRRPRSAVARSGGGRRAALMAELYQAHMNVTRCKAEMEKAARKCRKLQCDEGRVRDVLRLSDLVLVLLANAGSETVTACRAALLEQQGKTRAADCMGGKMPI